MSEYQYYEFQAVDRPLGDAEQSDLRALSTRARITATSFINTAPLRSAVADFMRGLSDDEKVALLVRLHDGQDPHLGAELRRRVRSGIMPSADATAKRRTVSELREIASRRAANREREAANRAAAEQRRRERDQAAARKRHLERLAARGDAAWSEVERLISLRNPLGYEKAATLLSDLRELARDQDRQQEFARRLAEVHARHEKKGRLLERLAAADLHR